MCNGYVFAHITMCITLIKGEAFHYSLYSELRLQSKYVEKFSIVNSQATILFDIRGQFGQGQTKFQQ